MPPPKKAKTPQRNQRTNAPIKNDFRQKMRFENKVGTGNFDAEEPPETKISPLKS